MYYPEFYLVKKSVKKSEIVDKPRKKKKEKKRMINVLKLMQLKTSLAIKYSSIQYKTVLPHNSVYYIHFCSLNSHVGICALVCFVCGALFVCKVSNQILKCFILAMEGM